jgi:phage terminase large subunit-like protein
MNNFVDLAQAELDRRRKAEFYLSSPFLFHRDLLAPPEKKEMLRKFHEEGLEFVESGKYKKKLILWPRGHLKSTIFTQGEVLRRLLKQPNLRVLINSSTESTGKSFLKAIKGYLMDPRIVFLYGNLLPNPKSGKQFSNNDSELTLLSRNNFTLKEPSIAIGGIDKTKTSQHYDLIIHDDLIVRENVGSFEVMDRVYTVWQDSLDLLEPGGDLWVIGTRWHPLDLYGRILTDFCDKRCLENDYTHVLNCTCKFDVSILEIKDKDGKYIFDSKFDESIAQELLQLKGRLEFSSQYLNNPADPGNVWFNHPHIKASETSPEEINKLRASLVWYMAVDPAESVERRSSYTACVGVGVDHSTGIWYVDYAKQARVETPEFINLVFEARKRIHPHRFGMEVSTRKALGYCLKDSMAKRGDFFIIEELKPMLGNTPEAKKTRIKRLIPLFEFGRIKINSTLSDLLAILYTLPAATTWDLVDALSYIMDMVPQGLGSQSKPVELPKQFIQNGGYSYAIRRTNSRIRSGRTFGRFYKALQPVRY